jgi:hypothetical protein
LKRRTNFGFIQELRKNDRDGIGFFAGGTPRDPDAEGDAGIPIFQTMGKNSSLQRFIGLRVPEEAGDMNQNIREQRMHFFRMLSKVSGVGL